MPDVSRETKQTTDSRLQITDIKEFMEGLEDESAHFLMRTVEKIGPYRLHFYCLSLWSASVRWTPLQ